MTPVKAKITYMRVSDLIPYDRNARVHNTELEFLCNSIKEFGFRNPILVDKNNIIIAGHGRRMAAMKLGLDRVPVIVCADLTDEQVKALRLADNKISDLSTWDLEMLDLELADMQNFDFDMENFGFTEPPAFDNGFEEDDDSEKDREPPSEDDSGDEEVGYEEELTPKQTSLPESDRVKRGDMFLLGRHRVMCGDSLDINDVRKLMDGAEADITFTSPPYNAGNIGTGRARDGQKYLNDSDTRSEEAYFEFLNGALANSLEVSREVFLNIALLSGSKRPLIRFLNENIDSFKDMIYWKKANPVPAIAKNIISSAVEWIMAFGRNNSRSFECDPGIYYGVIEGPKSSGMGYSDIHKATFPLYLPAHIIEKFTKEDGSVFDPFGGTGTTLIACEQAGRNCFMMDIEPYYVQVIIERWEKETGRKAVKL